MWGSVPMWRYFQKPSEAQSPWWRRLLPLWRQTASQYCNGAETYHVSWDIRLTWTADHFTRYAPEHIEYGVNRYQNETRRLYSVLDKHLASDNRPYLCGEKCTIAGKHSPRMY